MNKQRQTVADLMSEVADLEEEAYTLLARSQESHRGGQRGRY